MSEQGEPAGEDAKKRLLDLANKAAFTLTLIACGLLALLYALKRP